MKGIFPCTQVHPEGLRMRDIKLADGGTLPKTGTGKLELVYGNNVLTNFSERGNIHQDIGRQENFRTLI